MFDNEAFIEQLIIKAMPDIDDTGIDMLKDDIEPMIFDWVMTNIASKMDDKQAEEFMALVQKKAPEKDIYAYLSKIIPNYEKFMESVYDEFETMYLQEFKKEE
jgi:hypothetical protein